MERNAWFLANQYMALNAEMPGGKQENSYFTYPYNAFIDFMADIEVLHSGSDYLRIYFGCFDDKLDLIYSVRDIVAGSNKELYYVFNGTSFVPIAKGSAAQPGTASHRVSEYLRVKMPIINKQTGLSEATRSMRFEMAHIAEFLTEIKQQRPTSIKAYIASYTDSETCADCLPKRAFVNFVFTALNDQGKEVDMYIDDCANFRLRDVSQILEAAWAGLKDARSLTMVDYNNASLCPPKICDDITLP